MRFQRIAFVVSLLFASGLLADAKTFTIQMNAHAGTPAARVAVSFEYPAAADLTGATLTVGAITSPIVAGGFVTAAGDLISTSTPPVAPGTSKRIKINYLAASLFPANDYCTQPAGAYPPVTMTIDVPSAATTGYRINTYTVAGWFEPPNPALQSLDCSNPWRRLVANEASISFMGTTPDFRGRHPLDVVLVLDKSGSMASRPPGAASGPSKWDILEVVIPAFVNKWKIAGAPISTQSWENDRLGVSFFTTDATAVTMIARGSAMAPHPWDAISSAVTGEGPDALTAIGRGINRALDAVPTTPGTVKADEAHFIVMTDGIQNVDPELTYVPATTTLQLAPTGGGMSKKLYENQIPMQGIAFGTPASTQLDLITRMGHQTGGLAYQAVDESTSATMMALDTFTNTLVNVLKGSSLSLARREKGSLTGEAGPLFPIEVDSSVRRIMLSLEWLDRGQEMSVQLFPPGATPGPLDTGIAPTHSATEAFSLVRGFDLPAGTPSGTYLMRAVRQSSTTTGAPVPYNLSAHYIEGQLRFRLSFNEQERGTGDSVGVNAEVAFDRAPMNGLPPNAIRITIARPGEALGNILHDTDIDIPPAGGADPGSAYDRKLDALDEDLLGRVSPRDESTISLVSRGNGYYTGTFPNATVPGLYRFRAILDWDDPRTGRIRRIEEFERDVRVNADAASTQIATASLGRGSFQVTVTPRDRFGNYVGPGFGSRIVATANNGTITGPPTDLRQTGDYVFTIEGVPDGQQPDIDFKVDDLTVGNSSSSGGPSGQWRFFIDAGINDPDSAIDGKFSINAGIERMITSHWSVEGILGYHTFDGPIVDPDIWQLSGNAKYFFGTTAFRPFVNGGLGIYRVDPPDDIEFGFNAGAGLLYQVNTKWGVEGVFNMHSADIDWWTLQLGLRWSF